MVLFPRVVWVNIALFSGHVGIWSIPNFDEMKLTMSNFLSDSRHSPREMALNALTSQVMYDSCLNALCVKNLQKVTRLSFGLHGLLSTRISIFEVTNVYM